jgi:hypothetical protein
MPAILASEVANILFFNMDRFEKLRLIWGEVSAEEIAEKYHCDLLTPAAETALIGLCEEEAHQNGDL